MRSAFSLAGLRESDAAMGSQISQVGQNGATLQRQITDMAEPGNCIPATRV